MELSVSEKEVGLSDSRESLVT